jgi:hypothetical protein
VLRDAGAAADAWTWDDDYNPDALVRHACARVCVCVRVCPVWQEAGAQRQPLCTPAPS